MLSWYKHSLTVWCSRHYLTTLFGSLRWFSIQCFTSSCWSRFLAPQNGHTNVDRFGILLHIKGHTHTHTNYHKAGPACVHLCHSEAEHVQMFPVSQAATLLENVSNKFELVFGKSHKRDIYTNTLRAANSLTLQVCDHSLSNQEGSAVGHTCALWQHFTVWPNCTCAADSSTAK